MRDTEQFPGQSVLEHGESVWREALKLSENIPPELEPIKSRLQQLFQNRTEDIRQYCIYHDIGKPLSLVVDEEGRRHYPDHARISGDIARELGWNSAEWIASDMTIHSKEPMELLSVTDWEVLLLVGRAEIESNRPFFGETSYKIKLKRWKTNIRKLLGAK